MNEQVLNEAIEDVRLIKQIINKTADTVLNLGKIFLWWGVLYLVKLGIDIIMSVNENYFSKLSKANPFLNNFLGFSIYWGFVIAGILVFLYFSRKISLSGLSRQLMKIWLFIIGYNFLTPALYWVLKLASGLDLGMLFQSKIAVSLVTCAVGFFATYILTDFKLTKWLSMLYVATGIIAFKPGLLPGITYDCLWSITFLATGWYFECKNKKAGRN